eukprot:scaffold9334_cov63-Phaeocystis_antarctica.AAC.5
MITTDATSADQVHEPRRWPRTVSCMRWTSMRLTRPSVMQNATPQLSRSHRPVGAKSDVQMEIARLRAIRKTWHGKAIRKSCAAQAVSCEASAKVPVKGCIAMLAAAAAVLAAAASRSGHGSGSCSLRGTSRTSSMQTQSERRSKQGCAVFLQRGIESNTTSVTRHATITATPKIDQGA